MLLPVCTIPMLGQCKSLNEDFFVWVDCPAVTAPRWMGPGDRGGAGPVTAKPCEVGCYGLRGAFRAITGMWGNGGVHLIESCSGWRPVQGVTGTTKGAAQDRGCGFQNAPSGGV